MLHRIVGRISAELFSLNLDLETLRSTFDLIDRTGQSKKARTEGLRKKRHAKLRRAFWVHVDEYRPHRNALGAQSVDGFCDAVEGSRARSQASHITKINHQHRVAREGFDRVCAAHRANEMEVLEVGVASSQPVCGRQDAGGNKSQNHTKAETECA